MVEHRKFPARDANQINRNFSMTDGTKRSALQRGLKVSIVLKQDQQSGKLTTGIVRNILTKSATHPYGIKVRLENGLVGRVKIIHSQK